MSKHTILAVFLALVVIGGLLWAADSKESATATAVKVAVTLTTLDTLVLDGRGGRICFEVQNEDASDALDQFEVQIKPHWLANSWHTILSGTDFDSTGLATMIWATTTGPHECAAGGVAAAMIDIGPVYAVRFQAACAATDDGVANTQLRVVAERPE